MAVKRFPTVRDNGTVGTIESYLEQVFPKGSFYLKNPEGSNARSDQGTGTFRQDWAKHQNKTPEDYKNEAARRETVTVNTSYKLETIRRNVAEALGIPPTSIVLVDPRDEQPSKLNIQLSTFRGYWSKR